MAVTARRVMMIRGRVREGPFFIGVLAGWDLEMSSTTGSVRGTIS